MKKCRETPNRDDFYMGLAFWIASKSKDPDTQIGSLIVTNKNKPLSFGYNGPPSAIDDDTIDWSRPKKHIFLSHAEENAIKHSQRKKLKKSTLYVTAKPCKKCMLNIISYEIPRVIYFPFQPQQGSTLGNPDIPDETDEILNHIKYKFEFIKFNGNLNWILDRIENLKSLNIFSK